MKKRTLVICILAALAILTATAVPAYGDISVFINGKKVDFDVPPAKINGRTMVPLRGIFEGLGAEVRWDALTRTITAKRAAKEVRLTLGDRNAYINGDLRALDVPPANIQGRTMVPLRFVGEAFGAEVKWIGAAQSININDGSAAEPTVPVITPTPAPAASGEYKLQGVVYSIKKNPPYSIQVKKGNGIFNYNITPDTVIRLTDVSGSFSGSANIKEVYPGDQVTVTSDSPDSEQARRIDGRFLVEQGVISAYAEGKVILKKGKVVSVNPKAQVFFNEKPASLKDLLPGREGIFRVNPETKEAWWVVLAAKETKLSIDRFQHNTDKPVTPGDTVNFTLNGTPGGRASFTIPGVVKNIAMGETSPGVYTGNYTIRKSDPRGRYIPIASLTISGRNFANAQSKTALEISLYAAPAPAPTPVSNKAPQIIIPREDDSVDVPFIVMGKANPYAWVFVQVDQVADMGPISTTLEQGTEKIQADEQGNFKIRFEFLMKPGEARYIITAYQTDSTGKKSPEVKIQVRQK